MLEPDLHHYDKRLKYQVQTLKDAKISQRNKDLIFEFQRDCVVKGLSKPRIVKYLEVLRSSALLIQKDFDILSKDDIASFVQIIQEKDYSPWTKQSYKVMIKRFFKWFKGNNEDYPSEVRWINTSVKKTELKLPSEGDLVTPEEVQSLITATNSLRDKAFIALLYESGCRVSEVGNLKIKHINFDKIGALVTVFGKTGSRVIRVIGAYTYLQNWIVNHPYRNDRECYLWVQSSKVLKQVSYTYLAKILKNSAKKIGLTKRVNPHSFRHARATYLANHLTEFQMNQYFGWKQGSEMPATYIHMSGKSLNEAIIKLNDLEVQTKNIASKAEDETKINCVYCHAENPVSSKFCNVCGELIPIKQVQDNPKSKIVENMMNILLQDTEIQQMFMQKMVMRKP